MYHNVTIEEYSGLLPDVNVSAEHIFDEHGDQGGVCANYTRIIPPIQLYINLSHWIYPGEWNDVNYAIALKLCALVTIVVTGLFGNICVILTIALNRSIRTTLNFYIANLAVADATMCICAVPVLYNLLSRHFVFGYFVCKMEHFALYTCLVCSILTLAAISCDRFMAVFFPLHVRVTKQRKLLIVTLIWILSMVLSIPHIVGKNIQVTQWKNFQQKMCFGDWGDEIYHHESLGSCIVKSSLHLTEAIFMTVFIYFLPIIIMITAYFFILWKLSRTEAPGDQLLANNNIHASANKREHKMVFTVLLVFAICSTPYYAALLFDLTHPKSMDYPNQWSMIGWIFWNMLIGNSMMNPIIYAGMKQEFRRGIFAVLRCRKPVIRAKPPQNERSALAGGNKQEPREANLELEIKDPVAGGL